MPSGRATACSDCHQSTVSCAVLCAPFRAHLARQTRHHVTLSRPVRFRWQPVRPWRCSGPGQLPSHRPGGAAACRGRRQCTGDTGVLPSQGHVAVRTLWATAISTPGKWIYWPPSLPCTERCTDPPVRPQAPAARRTEQGLSRIDGRQDELLPPRTTFHRHSESRNQGNFYLTPPSTPPRSQASLLTRHS